ncbi:MAG TPA: hypothetical protein EYO76_05275 [Flavobacteriaceae bacterium]|nr:hypothetical protein [Flavobacteriaceae bacterium]
MKHLPKIVLFTFLFMLATFVQAQEQSTILHKNFNIIASGLAHDLNQKADTLFVKSDKPVLRVSFLSHEQNKDVRIDINSKKVNVPLHYLSEGRYTIAVYREDIIVAFGIERKLKIEASENTIEDFEEGVLQASLSKEEKERRYLKPITKGEKNDTRLASVTENKNSRNSSERKLRNNSSSNRDKIEKHHKSWLEKQRSIAEANHKESQQEKEAKQKAYQEYLAKIKEAKSKDEVVVLNETSEIEDSYKPKDEDSKERNIADASKNDFEANTREIEAAKKRLLAELEGKSTDKELNRREVTKAKVEVKDVKYDLSTINYESVNRQTREDYRKSHLRPNGKPYDE